MALSSKQKRALKGQAHAQKVIVQTGSKGVTDAIVEEARVALAHHELLKIKLVADAESRPAMAAELCTRLDAEQVAQIGQVAVLYRLNPDRAKYGAVLKQAAK